MSVADFFKGLFKFVKKIVPHDQLVEAIELCRMAATHYSTNQERRNAVITLLMDKFHIPENVARLLVEIAVAHIKHGIDSGVDAVEEKV